MRQIYILLTILICLLGGNKINAQSTEDFEDETSGSSTFTDSGQSFDISSNVADDVFGLNDYTGGGWNGTSIDNIFIDNTSISFNDGTSFIISTTDGADITIKSFYLFVSNYTLDGPGTPTTITIEGKKDGNNVFTITKNSNIVDGSTFTPNNGYTFIDLATEGVTDNSNENIDEIIISTTGDADYLSLDAFTWGYDPLSTGDLESQSNNIRIYPNPSSQFIQISNLKSKEPYNIYNALGSVIKNGFVSNNEQIDIKDFYNGLYFLKFDNGNTIKFIKK